MLQASQRKNQNSARRRLGEAILHHRKTLRESYCRETETGYIRFVWGHFYKRVSEHRAAATLSKRVEWMAKASDRVVHGGQLTSRAFAKHETGFVFKFHVTSCGRQRGCTGITQHTISSTDYLDYSVQWQCHLLGQAWRVSWRIIVTFVSRAPFSLQMRSSVWRFASFRLVSCPPFPDKSAKNSVRATQ